MCGESLMSDGLKGKLSLVDSHSPITCPISHSLLSYILSHVCLVKAAMGVLSDAIWPSGKKVVVSVANSFRRA